MRVVVVEDQALLREGIVALLAENGIEVVAQAEDGPGLLRIVDGHKPDLAICDVRLPPTFTDEGIRAALEARRRHPELAILVLSQYVEPVYTGELLAAGRAGSATCSRSASARCGRSSTRSGASPPAAPRSIARSSAR